SNFFGHRTNFQVKNSKSGRYQFQSFKQGVWRYKYLKAFKPLNGSELKVAENDEYDLDVKEFVDQEALSDRFPILSWNGLSLKNLAKRVMHFYLETNIRDNRSWF
ncbi:MAG: hypothetical protein AAGC88_14270, partial [Bacteroidota bacterium]